MKIAILTFHKAYNCGAMLQAWALFQTLTKFGHKVSFPDCNIVGLGKSWRFKHIPEDRKGLRWWRSFVGRLYLDIKDRLVRNPFKKEYDEFRNQYLPETICNMDRICGMYDFVVVGSDQVWNPDITASDTALFLCEGIALRMPCVSYAGSSGEKKFSKYELDRLVNALNAFHAVSVREETLRRLLVGKVKRDIQVVTDPVFLLTSSEYELFYSKKLVTVPYLYFYTVYCNDKQLEIARKVAAKMKLKLVVSPARLGSSLFMPLEADPILRPDRVVNYIRHARCVIAASYHGTAFAAIFDKPFATYKLRSANGVKSRPEDLAESLGAGNRIIDMSTSIETMCSILNTPLDPRIGKNIERLREESVMWLQNATM